MTSPGGEAVLTLAPTIKATGIAKQLPYALLEGEPAAVLREHWESAKGFILVMSSGDAIRAVGPLLDGHDDPPSVVVVDEGGRYAVPLTGGSTGEANDLAREVAAAIGAQSVDIPAEETSGFPDIATIPGFTAEGDVLGVQMAVREGRRPTIVNPLHWPIPWALEGAQGSGPERIGVTDELIPFTRGVALLRPPSLVIGVGTAGVEEPGVLWDLVIDTLAAAGLARSSVAEVATMDSRVNDAVVSSLGIPVRGFTADELAMVPVPNPSVVVQDAIGTPSVAEASALLAAGPEGGLLVGRRSRGGAVVSIARRKTPRLVSVPTS